MKNKILNDGPLNTDVAAFLLRLVFGGLFIYHGWQKIAGFSEISPQFPDLIGIGGKLSFLLVIFAEFVCGIFVVFGFYTRLAAVPILITMIVAFFVAHAKDAFNAKELAFVFMLLSVVIFVLGSGKFSVDRLLQKKRKKKYSY
jgi:putative oxidoreductase